MAKKRKTRKEKELAAKRQTLAPEPQPEDRATNGHAVAAPSFTFSLSDTKIDEVKQEEQTVTTTHTTHLTEDLARTGIVTFSILFAEIILSFLLKAM